MTASYSQLELDAIVSPLHAQISLLKSEVTKLVAALHDAKNAIRVLRSAIYGTSAERGTIVLTAEGQEYIDPAWTGGTEASPQPAPPGESTESARLPATKKPRDPRGLAQRHPHLAIVAENAPLDAVLQEQVDAGVLLAVRSTTYEDSLVAVREDPFIRRVYAVDLVKPGSATPALVVAPPERIIPGGVLADASIHGLVVAKFLDAMPFHRTLKAWERLELDVSRQVVNDAFTGWANLMKPLAEAIYQRVFHAPIVHADESWARVQAAKTCASVNVWTVVGDDLLAYRFTPDRTHVRANDIIPATFRGQLVTDAWAGWKTVTTAQHAGCLAHARRPFFQIAKLAQDAGSTNPEANLILKLIADVYRIEGEAKEGPAESYLDRVRTLRTAQTAPLMGRIKTEATRLAESYAKDHPLAKASRYILNHYETLTAFLTDPRLPPDNNTAENALRITALIRKNSLFFGSDEGGERAATALTVLHSCRIRGVEPHAYLQRVTPALLLHRLGKKVDIDALLPQAAAPPS